MKGESVMLVEKKIRKAVKILKGFIADEYKGRDVEVCVDWISINEELGITLEMRLATADSNITEGIRIFIAYLTFNQLSIKQLAAYCLAYVHEATE